MLYTHTSGAGPRLVLVHGFTQTGRSWARVARDLAADHEVAAVDLPGHGGSGDLRADLVESAVLLGDACGPAVYVGYSLGARVALHLALLRPALVRSLVLLGATAGIDDPTERAARRAADDALATSIERDGVDRFLNGWLAQPLFARLPVDPEDRADRRRNTAAGLASSLRLAGTGIQTPLWDRLAAITCPTLALAGEHDEKFRALGTRVAAGIRGATFAVVPGAGHAAHLEQPEAFVRLLRSWLAEHADRPDR